MGLLIFFGIAFLLQAFYDWVDVDDDYEGKSARSTDAENDPSSSRYEM